MFGFLSHAHLQGHGSLSIISNFSVCSGMCILCWQVFVDLFIVTPAAKD